MYLCWVEHEKPGRRLVDQRGRRSRTLYRKLKQMQMQTTYWLEKVLKMISLNVNAFLCTLQHIVIHAMQLSGVNSENCMTICCTVHKSALTYKEIIFSTFSNQ